MYRVLFAATFLLTVRGSSVADNVRILLKLGEEALSSFKAELEAENAVSVVKTFKQMVLIDANLQQAIVLLEEIKESAELVHKVRVLISKYDRVVPHAEYDRKVLIADILSKSRGIETMTKLLKKLEK